MTEIIPPPKRVRKPRVDIALSSPLARDKPIGTEVAVPEVSTREVERRASRLGKRYLANAILRLVELAELDRENENGELMPLSGAVDRRTALVAAQQYIEKVMGKERIMDPEILEPTRPKFDPSLYTPEQLEQIEKTLRMVQAIQSRDE